MTIVFRNVAVAPTGSVAQFTTTLGGGSFKVASVSGAVFGQFAYHTGNGTNGGMPAGGFQRFVPILPLLCNALPSFTETPYLTSSATVPADVGPRAMTSATTPSPYVITSSSSAFNPIWQTFDGNYGTTGTLTSGGFGSPVYVEVDLGAANAAPITGYAIYGDGGGFTARFPKDFTLQGSNDNSVWTTLDAQTSQTDASPRTYTLGGITASYRYYKIVITANNGDTSYTDIVELRLYNGTRVLNTYCTIAPLYLGGIRLSLIGGMFLTVAVGVPAVQLPAGMIVSISC
jgi:F5/8 type C domain-containing protein